MPGKGSKVQKQVREIAGKKKEGFHAIVTCSNAAYISGNATAIIVALVICANKYANRYYDNIYFCFSFNKSSSNCTNYFQCL